ncbi:MAG: haloacid dehalogenase [Euryarchaeota archaeon]|nr:haloacid dehalogenase [Euryarchaeota archaeon]
MDRRPLAGLGPLARRLDAELASKDAVRERTIALSRELVRTCSEAIRALRESGRAAKALGRADRLSAELRKVTDGHPELHSSGTVQNALQELAEAHILESLLSGRAIAAPSAYGCTPAAFLLGMGDAIGELRRISQDALRRGDIREAGDALHVMEGLFATLSAFDYPDAIVPLRHKQDVARGLIEKTRGEVAVAARGRDLERKIAALEKVLARHAPRGR